MDSGQAIDLVRQAVMLLLIVGAPVLVTGLVVGIIVSVIQAATQVQEHTLSFVPKIIAMLIMLVLTGGWMLSRLAEFAREMFSTLP